MEDILLTGPCTDKKGDFARLNFLSGDDL